MNTIGKQDREFLEYFSPEKDMGKWEDLTMNHRLRPMAEIGGVSWIDDRQEQAPTANSVWYALASMYQQTVWVTEAGTWNEASLNELQEVVKSTVKAIVVIGDAITFHTAFQQDVIIARASNTHQAEDLAQRMARPGDAILFT